MPCLLLHDDFGGEQVGPGGGAGGFTAQAVGWCAAPKGIAGSRGSFRELVAPAEAACEDEIVNRTLIQELQGIIDTRGENRGGLIAPHRRAEDNRHVCVRCNYRAFCALQNKRCRPHALREGNGHDG